MKHTALICKKCHTLIFSRCRHDMIGCDCESIYIDGGFNYCKISGNPEDIICKNIILEDSIRYKLPRLLYFDWSLAKDVWGKYSLTEDQYNLLALENVNNIYITQDGIDFKEIEYKIMG